MSFQDIGKTAKTTQQNTINDTRKSSQTQQDPVIRRITETLEQYKDQADLLSKMSFKFDRGEDTNDFRQQILTQCMVVEDLYSRIQSQINDCETKSDKNKLASRRGFITKLKNDLEKVNKTANQTIKNCKAKLERPIYSASGSQEDTYDSDFHGGQIITRYQVLEEEVNAQIIEETEQELLKINQDVHKINEIQKDLAAIVQNQQSTVDSIQNFVDESYSRAQKGLEQVEKAAKHQPVCIIS